LVIVSAACATDLIKNATGVTIPGVTAPTSLDTLAAAAVEACLDESVSGKIDNEGMCKLASRSTK